MDSQYHATEHGLPCNFSEHLQDILYTFETFIRLFETFIRLSHFNYLILKCKKCLHPYATEWHLYCPIYQSANVPSVLHRQSHML